MKMLVQERKTKAVALPPFEKEITVGRKKKKPVPPERHE